MRSSLVLIFCISLFVNQYSFAQNQDTLSKIERLQQLDGEAYFSQSIDLAENLLENDSPKALELIDKLLNDEGISTFPVQKGRALYAKGMVLSLQGKYKESHDFLDKSIGIFDTQNQTILKGKSLAGKGVTFLSQGEYAESKNALENSIKILEPTGNKTELAQSYLELGKVFGFLNEHVVSLGYLNKSLAIHQELGDSLGVSNDYYRMAVHYYDTSNEEKALEFFTKSRAMKADMGDRAGYGKISTSLGVLHSEKSNYKTAIDYYHESLKAHQEIGDKPGEAIVLNNMGIAYVDWGKYDSAYAYHEKSLKLNKEINYPIGIIRSQANIGEVFQFQKEYAQAAEQYLNAKKLSTRTKNEPLMRLISDKLGEIYLDTDRLDSAQFYLNKALEIRLGQNNYFGLRGTYENLSKLTAKQGDFKKAYEYHQLFKKVQDSFVKTRAASELAEVQAKYDTERQEREINQLQQENKTKTLWQNILGFSTFLAIVLGIIAFQFIKYRNNKNRELLELKEGQRQQLEEVNELKSRFFNNISHEFRTPLTLILGPLKEIKESVATSKQSTVDMIERNGKRLLKLINQLLDLSKIESGHLKLKTSYIDVVPQIKGWVNSFESMATMNDIRLSFESDWTTHFLYVDSEKLEEVILNLVSNAIKYSPKNRAVVVRLNKWEEDETQQLCIAVQDSGRGIPQHEIERVFDRFYQASNSENVVGTGIGLSLVKELVELHKGTVEVESEQGKGTTFKVFLPYGKEHLADHEIALISPSTEETAEKPAGTFQPQEEAVISVDDSLPLLLLIEDNADLRIYIRGILQDRFTISEAVDGKEGVEKALELIPDIIISDLMMPKMDGLEVCKTVKEDYRTSHVPVILLTAKSSKEDKMEGLRSMADDYLTKPFDKEELLLRIENLIAIRNKIQASFGSAAILKPKKIQMSSMDQTFMENIREHLEEQIANPMFGVVELAEKVSLSRSQLLRKVKAITNLSPNEFIRSFRLHRAMELLKQQTATVSEIAFDTGFQNASYFAKCFQEQFGMSPSEVAKK